MNQRLERNDLRMPTHRRCWGYIGIVLSVALLPILVWADNDLWWPQPIIDPMRSSSLPLDLARTYAPEAGEWKVLLTTGYFNELSSSWHTGSIHRELGRKGEALLPDELRLTELRHPDDSIFHIDLEGVRSELWLSYGLSRRWGLTVSIPWMKVGSPGWDTISSTFHSWFGIPQNDRLVFQRNQSQVYLFQGATRLEELSLAGSGMGDVTVSLSGPVGDWLGGKHRWAFSVEMPTGRAHTLFGSGGWDFGLQWTGSWVFEKSNLEVGTAIIKLDSSGSWLGVTRNDTWHFVSRYSRRLGNASTVSLEARLDESPLSETLNSYAGDPSFIIQLGWRRNLGERIWLGAVYGGNYPIESGVQPDFTFSLQVGTR